MEHQFQSLGTQGMSLDSLNRAAPSIFAEHAHEKVSDRYQFIPTARVLDQLATEGFFPVMASEQRVRLDSRRGFQKHMLRLRRAQDITSGLTLGQEIPEIVLLNSHDRSSAYQIHAGLFRLICSNGMVVADSTFNKISTKHVGFNPKDVIEASFRVIDDIPRIMDSVQGLKSVTLNP